MFECRADLIAQCPRTKERRTHQILGHVGLVGKIYPRLDKCERLNQAMPPRLDAVADQTLELPVGEPALRRGFRRYQIGQTFNGRQIEPPVLESAAREFAGLGYTAAFDR